MPFIKSSEPSAPKPRRTHFGIGGAGNIRAVKTQAAPAKPQQSSVPHRPVSPSGASARSSLSNGRFATGRGGAGNMVDGSDRAMFSFDEELKRDALRHDRSAPVYHVGRGGAGNIEELKHEYRVSHDSRASSDFPRKSQDSAWSRLSDALKA